MEEYEKLSLQEGFIHFRGLQLPDSNESSVLSTNSEYHFMPG